MPATATDRLSGVTTSVAVKAPVKAVFTTPITLIGLQGGLSEGDRALVAGQSNAIDNGIYSVSSSDWQRTSDFDGARDVVNGTLVVLQLSGGNGAFYQVNGSDPIYPGTTHITFSLRDNPNITYQQTPADIAASVIPVNYAYAGYPIIYADRYGWSESASSSVNTTAINNAISVAKKYTNGGAIVQLPPGTFDIGTSLIDIPQAVTVKGSGNSATIITSSNTGAYAFRLGGASTGALKYSCGLIDVAIRLSQTNGKAIVMLETALSFVRRVYLEGPINSVRSTKGLVVDGGNASAFNNVIDQVQANHFHVGFEQLTTGTTQPTQQTFIQCLATGDVATDTTSIGYRLSGASGTGGGSTWIGGNLESCNRGMYFTSGCGSSSNHGVRFEGNTKEVEFEATPGSQIFVGCYLDSDGGIVDASDGSLHKFIACVNGSNTLTTEKSPGAHVMQAHLTGQTPLILQGFPGDTTTEQLIIQNSAGAKQFSITNQGKFYRVAGSTPGTVAGAKGGNAALTSLISVLSAYGFIVDSTT